MHCCLSVFSRVCNVRWLVCVRVCLAVVIVYIYCVSSLGGVCVYACFVCEYVCILWWCRCKGVISSSFRCVAVSVRSLSMCISSVRLAAAATAARRNACVLCIHIYVHICTYMHKHAPNKTPPGWMRWWACVVYNNMFLYVCSNRFGTIVFELYVWVEHTLNMKRWTGHTPHTHTHNRTTPIWQKSDTSIIFVCAHNGAVHACTESLTHWVIHYPVRKVRRRRRRRRRQFRDGMRRA